MAIRQCWFRFNTNVNNRKTDSRIKAASKVAIFGLPVQILSDALCLIEWSFHQRHHELGSRRHAHRYRYRVILLWQRSEGKRTSRPSPITTRAP